jgi:integrase
LKQEELQQLLNFVKYIPDDKRDETTNVILRAAADSMSLEKIQSLADCTNADKANEKKDTTVQIWKFSAKEYSKMPEQFKELFKCKGYAARIYRRKSGSEHFNYEIRLRRDGLNIYASANELDEAKYKFMQALVNWETYGDKNADGIPTTFDGFANYFFENFYKRKVCASTYRITLNQYKNHIKPEFGNIPIKRIQAMKCQDLIDRLDEEGKGKTSEDVFTILNLIFKAAIKHSLINQNPLDMIFHTKHDREHGSALSKDEEKHLLNSMEGQPQQLMFAIGLYTGMRPNEYATAKIEGDFIIAVNSKRKNGKVEYKKIPITPMLKPFLVGITELKFSSLRVLRARFNKLFPDRRLYDLRTTFYTRCQECGVAPAARDEFVGHSFGALGNAYTDLSDEFLLKEGAKLCY